MPRNKESIAIYVTPEQAERLRVLKEATGVPTSVVLREAIDYVLVRREKALDKLMAERERDARKQVPVHVREEKRDEPTRREPPPPRETNGARVSARRT